MSDTVKISAVNKSVYWKQKMRQAFRDSTGTAFCTSCQQSKPAAEVKAYRPANPKARIGKSVVRCDACQSRRVAYMKSRKA